LYNDISPGKQPFDKGSDADSDGLVMVRPVDAIGRHWLPIRLKPAWHPSFPKFNCDASLASPPPIQICGILWHKPQGVFGGTVVLSAASIDGGVFTTGGGCTVGGGTEDTARELLTGIKKNNTSVSTIVTKTFTILNSARILIFLLCHQ
jgi:hypothetical protein